MKRAIQRRFDRTLVTNAIRATEPLELLEMNAFNRRRFSQRLGAPFPTNVCLTLVRSCP